MKHFYLKTFLLCLLALAGIKAMALEYDCIVDGIYYNLKGDEAEVTHIGYVVDIIVIPSSIQYEGVTYSVTSIGDRAFDFCSFLTSIVIPNSVTSIGEYAFEYCTSLTSMKIPNSVTSIGRRAFSECSSLTSIEIPDRVKSIGDGTFYNCSSLTSIEIPNSVTSIGEYAFSGCSGLTSIEIPKSVKSIGDGTFEKCSSLTSIEIPNSVTTIGEYTFSGCSGLTSIVIPKSVICIGSWDDVNRVVVCWGTVFEGCSSLNSIEVEQGNPVYDSRGNCNAIIYTQKNELIAGCKNTIIPNGVTSIGMGAFSGCSSLTSIEIPNSVTSIRGEAFENCSSLTSIEIPNSVTGIYAGAFYGCSGLTSIFIPKSVTTIIETAYSGCSSLVSMEVEQGNLVYDSRGNCNAIIDTKNNKLIAGCKNTVIPNSVTTIGGGAFSGCSGLISLEIPNSVTSIGESAFRGCSGLTSIVIPNSVTSIGDRTFQNCSSLTSIVIPNSVTSIGDGTFQNCSSLTSIVIPNNVPTIGYETFSGCSSLTSIEIPNSVIVIGELAFCQCSSLTSIVIPNSVIFIASAAFCDCTSLLSVTSYIEEPFAIYENVFSVWPNNDFNDFTTAILYVPIGTKEKYAATDGWKKFMKIEEMELQPVDDGQIIDIGDEIDEDTDIDGKVVGDIYYSISDENGMYSPEEGCIVVSKPTDDSVIDGKGIFGDDFKDNYTGVVFKVGAGKGTIKVQAQTTGNMVMKVKIGDNEPITMELEGKLKVSFPYNVSEDTYVYIYGGVNTSNAKGTRWAESVDGTLKIYGIEVERETNGIETIDSSSDDISTIYDLSGHRINSLQRGINILRMSDGTTKKIVVK